MAKPPSWNEIRANAAAFATRWRDEASENASAQTFWNEFLQIFGVDRKRVATFEARARRQSTGGRGRIDLLWPSTLIAEHKSLGGDLAEAETQALDYLDSLDEQNIPGVVICSDFATIRIRDLSGDNQPFTFPIVDLVKEIDRFGFIAGYARRDFTGTHEQEANAEAAQLMAKLYAELQVTGFTGHDASIFMTRLLFVLFGDDTGMWEKDLFSEYVHTRTQQDGSDLGPQLSMLFQVLNQAEASRPNSLDGLLQRFPHVNGGIFADRIDIPAFDRKMRDELLNCCRFDWGLISPAIFGSMFQAVKSKTDRRQLGEHYTSEENILKLISSLFLDELKKDLQSASKSPLRLRRLHDRLATLRFLDPACGCGNFLVVAYRELRALELDILKYLRDLGARDNQLSLDVTLDLRLSLDQFFGIEIEEWPARIAETAMFLVDHQANLALAEEFGEAPDRLPIREAAKIQVGNALRLDWNALVSLGEITYVLGNPPFLGSRLQSAEQKADQARTWGETAKSGTLNFVSNWFMAAARLLLHRNGKAAFVATSSISRGEQPSIIWGKLSQEGLEIDFAHTSFVWENEAPGQAGVNVVIVGFSRQPRTIQRPLFLYTDQRGQPRVRVVRNINAYLIDGPNILVSSRRTPLVAYAEPMISGNVPRDGGYLSKLSSEEADEVRRTDSLASRFLHEIYGSDEHIQGTPRWCLWLVDATPQDIRQSVVLRERVERVRQERSGAPGSKGRAVGTPHLFADIYQPADEYLLMPSVCSENRDYIPVSFYRADQIITNAVFAVPGASLETFGLLSSAVFLRWVDVVSSRLASSLQLSSGMSYNTFPRPELDVRQRGLLEQRAADVLAQRQAAPGATLADLYDRISMPRELRHAHRELDRVVLRAYGLTAGASEADILRALFDRYVELAGANT